MDRDREANGGMLIVKEDVTVDGVKGCGQIQEDEET